jgi:hypothetical protein
MEDVAMAKKSSPGRTFPTADELRKSPAVYFQYYEAKKGKEKELLDALVKAAEVVKKENGVDLVSIFELAHGVGPNYLLTLKLANPKVLTHLRKQTDLVNMGVQISSLAEQTSHVTFSQRAQGRLG